MRILVVEFFFFQSFSKHKKLFTSTHIHTHAQTQTQSDKLLFSTWNQLKYCHVPEIFVAFHIALWVVPLHIMSNAILFVWIWIWSRSVLCLEEVAPALFLNKLSCIYCHNDECFFRFTHMIAASLFAILNMNYCLFCQIFEWRNCIDLDSGM